METRLAKFCRAVLPDGGLGNRLFPWARCKVYSLANDIPMLAPTWSQFKLGPMLRREKDWRIYRGLFCHLEEEIRGIEKLRILTCCNRLAESANHVSTPPTKADCLIEFSGLNTYFSPLCGLNAIVRDELKRITAAQWLSWATNTSLPAIGIHVRRGDFARPKSEAELLTRGGVRTPLEWFADTLTALRDVVGGLVPAFVVSDGDWNELRSLMLLPQVKLIQTGSAIGDLWALSNAKLIIGSGGSSFSAWASYLGEVPVLAIRGQSLKWFGLEHKNGSYVGVFPGDALDPEYQMFLSSLRQKLLGTSSDNAAKHDAISVLR